MSAFEISVTAVSERSVGVSSAAATLPFDPIVWPWSWVCLSASDGYAIRACAVLRTILNARSPTGSRHQGQYMKEWIDYYDTAHSIYVNARHRDVHFQGIARHIVTQHPSPDAVVLDYSCGEACSPTRSPQLPATDPVEPAPGVRARLIDRFGKNPRIVCARGELAAMPRVGRSHRHGVGRPVHDTRRTGRGACYLPACSSRTAASRSATSSPRNGRCDRCGGAVAVRRA